MSLISDETPVPSNYNLIEYPGYCHPQTHPDRLGAIGAVFGLKPAPTRRCRVLELGCGQGTNLIPMAAGYPDSEFVGIDLAATPIAHGQRTVNGLNLKNVRLIQGSLTGIHEGWGKFDYIIAHGVYSWVPPEVQAAILRVCRHNLAANGLAFVSYNALPGCHMRLMLREMMLFHVRGFESPLERVRQARALTSFLAESQNGADEYHSWMKAELAAVLERHEGNIFHDELAEVNEPMYFHQFAGQAAAHGLQFLGEADYFEMFGHGLTEPTKAGLAQLGRNRIVREQYLDFIKCRRFRQTLLCHHEIPLHNEPQSGPVASFLVSSHARCSGPELDLKAGVAMVYKTPKGATCSTDYALGKAALAVLEKHWPAPLAFADLFQAATDKLAQTGIGPVEAGESAEKLAAFLLDIYGADILEFRTDIPPVVWTVSDKPVANALARWQAGEGDFVTSGFHMAVKLEDETGRFLLRALDGTKDRAALIDEIRQQVVSGNLNLKTAEGAIPALEIMEQDLERNLVKLAGFGLLAG